MNEYEINYWGQTSYVKASNPFTALFIFAGDTEEMKDMIDEGITITQI